MHRVYFFVRSSLCLCALLPVFTANAQVATPIQTVPTSSSPLPPPDSSFIACEKGQPNPSLDHFLQRNTPAQIQADSINPQKTCFKISIRGTVDEAALDALESLINKISETLSPNVRIEPNMQFGSNEIVLNDPIVDPRQLVVNNVGCSSFYSSTNCPYAVYPPLRSLAEIDPNATYSIPIGIIDADIDPLRLALSDITAPLRNLPNSSTYGSSHGLSVAWTIAAVPNNGTGGAGIYPSADWSAYGISNDRVFTLEKLVSALDRVLALPPQQRPRVLNLSWGGAMSQIVFDKIAELRNSGTLVVAAAGNYDGYGPAPESNAPANFPGVLSVGASRSNPDEIGAYLYPSYYSHQAEIYTYGDGYDPFPEDQNQPDLSCGAPASSGSPSMVCYKYGTSFASPRAAGTLAWLLDNLERLSPSQTAGDRIYFNETAKDVLRATAAIDYRDSSGATDGRERKYMRAAKALDTIIKDQANQKLTHIGFKNFENATNKNWALTKSAGEGQTSLIQYDASDSQFLWVHDGNCMSGYSFRTTRFNSHAEIQSLDLTRIDSERIRITAQIKHELQIRASIKVPFMLGFIPITCLTGLWSETSDNMRYGSNSQGGAYPPVTVWVEFDPHGNMIDSNFDIPPSALTHNWTPGTPTAYIRMIFKNYLKNVKTAALAWESDVIGSYFRMIQSMHAYAMNGDVNFHEYNRSTSQFLYNYRLRTGTPPHGEPLIRANYVLRPQLATFLDPLSKEHARPIRNEILLPQGFSVAYNPGLTTTPTANASSAPAFYSPIVNDYQSLTTSHQINHQLDFIWRSVLAGVYIPPSAPYSTGPQAHFMTVTSQRLLAPIELRINMGFTDRPSVVPLRGSSNAIARIDVPVSIRFQARDYQGVALPLLDHVSSGTFRFYVAASNDFMRMRDSAWTESMSIHDVRDLLFHRNLMLLKGQTEFNFAQDLPVNPHITAQEANLAVLYTYKSYIAGLLRDVNHGDGYDSKGLPGAFGIATSSMLSMFQIKLVQTPQTPQDPFVFDSLPKFRPEIVQVVDAAGMQPDHLVRDNLTDTRFAVSLPLAQHGVKDTTLKTYHPRPSAPPVELPYAAFFMNAQQDPTKTIGAGNLQLAVVNHGHRGEYDQFGNPNRRGVALRHLPQLTQLHASQTTSDDLIFTPQLLASNSVEVLNQEVLAFSMGEDRQLQKNCALKIEIDVPTDDPLGESVITQSYVHEILKTGHLGYQSQPAVPSQCLPPGTGGVIIVGDGERPSGEDPQSTSSDQKDD